MADRLGQLEADLPLPRQDTGALGEAVRCLVPVAQQAGHAVARTLPGSWQSGSRCAADQEVAAVGALTAEAGHRAEVARLTVADYVSAVVGTRGTVLRLRQEWERAAERRDSELRRAGQARHQPGRPEGEAALAQHQSQIEQTWADARSELIRAHRQAMRALEAAGGRCAGVLLRCAGELPGADVGSTRAAVLAGLPTLSALLSRAEATRAVDDLQRQMGGLPPDQWDRDPSRVKGVLPALLDTMRDPFVASELMTRMGPSALYRLVLRLQTHARISCDAQDRAAAIGSLRTLGVAFSTAANPLYCASRSEAARSELDQRRAEWLRQLAGTAVQLLEPGRGGARFTGVDAQGILLRSGAEAGVVPGREYAAALAAAFATVDSTRAPAARDPRKVGPLEQLDVREDPMRDLLVALRGDPEAIRAAMSAVWAPAALDGPRRVLDYLVTDRPFRQLVDPTFNRALADDLRAATAGTSRDAALLASRLFEALARGGRRATDPGTPDEQQLRRQLAMDDLRQLAVTLFTAHPQIVADALVRRRDLGADTVEPDADRIGYTPTIRSRSSLAALLGDLGLTRVTPGATDPDGLATHELADVLGSVVTVEAGRLAAALAAQSAHGERATDEDRMRVSQQLTRLAQVMGFCGEVAGRQSAALHAVSDRLNDRARQLYGMAIDRLQLPPALRSSLPGWAAELAVRVARTGLTRIVEDAYPVDAAAAAGARSERSLVQQEDSARAIAWDVVAATRSDSVLRSLAHSEFDTDSRRFWDPASGRLLTAEQLDDPSDPHRDSRVLAAERWAQAQAPEFAVLQSTILAELRAGRVTGQHS